MKPASYHFTGAEMLVLRRAAKLALRGNRSVRVPSKGWLVVPDVLVVEAAANGWPIVEGFEIRGDDERVVYVYSIPGAPKITRIPLVPR